MRGINENEESVMEGALEAGAKKPEIRERDLGEKVEKAEMKPMIGSLEGGGRGFVF